MAILSSEQIEEVKQIAARHAKAEAVPDGMKSFGLLADEFDRVSAHARAVADTSEDGRHAAFTRYTDDELIDLFADAMSAIHDQDTDIRDFAVACVCALSGEKA